MSEVSKRCPRRQALAAATAIALSALCVQSANAAERLNLSGLQSADQDGFDRFIVKYRDGSGEHADVAAVKTALDRAAAGVASLKRTALGLQHVRRLATQADAVKSSRKLDRVEAEALMRQIAADPDVEYVEVDQMLHALAVPNDTRYSEQWGYFNPTAGINLPAAWDQSTGSGVVVAVLDTGITPHSDLNANIVPGYDFISDTSVSVDGDGRDPDPNDPGDGWTNYDCGVAYGRTSNSSWHGTHVAGTVAAVTNNSKGVAGVAYGAKVQPVRVLGKCGGLTSDIADAIVWASGGTVSGVPANPTPAEVINMSLGGSGSCGNTTQNAINGAVGRGTTVVVAAGNGNNNASGNNPANCGNVVVVGAVDSNGARSVWSSSQASSYGTVVDVAAPGTDILSTLNAGALTQGAESYAFYSGTSMATPHVAGVVALMQAAAPTPLTPAQVEATLKSTTKPFPATPSQPIGTGIVDAAAAVIAAQGGGSGGGGGGGGDLQNGVPVTGLSATTGNTLEYTLTVPAGATGLTIAISGGIGDADLYVKYGSAPTDSSYDCRPYRSGNAESCSFSAPQAGTYYVRIKAYSSFSGVTLTASYNAGSGGGNVLGNGVPVTGLTATSGNALSYTVQVPSGRSSLSVAISGGSGDADLYVRRGSAPTDSAYDCRPYLTGNAETCTFSSPAAGTYYIRVKAYSTYAGVSLVANY